MGIHESRMLRHAVVMRELKVLRTERLTPHMQRIVLGGAALAGFVSAAPDDHVKLFFPNKDGRIVQPVLGPDGLAFPADVDPSPMRDYTPRSYDEARGELTIDFVLHGDGPAASWAMQAQPGQRLGIGGPRGSHIVADDFDRYVMVGDETALPAIGRWLKELPRTAKAIALIEIPEPGDHQMLASQAEVELQWLERQGIKPEESTLLEQALEHLPAMQGDTFYWIAAESRRARRMRQWLSEHRHVPKDYLKATGYWKFGDED
ncbi:MAG TPA: siderophore-interacting protein [Dyella sp.]|uniref:siderophore-interacting protein n=1 Tax=Dyella sp. TaxID=1869338 RepID=UPI002F95C459